MFALSRVKKYILIFLVLMCGCAGQPKEKKITVWHWSIDRKDALNELGKQYEELTGIPVQFKLFFPPDIYSQKVIAAARAGNLPEIFGILGEKKTLASFINAGHILDLTSYMNEDGAAWKNSFYPQALRVITFDSQNTYGMKEGIYGVPIDTTIMLFLYNKDLFKKAGLDPNRPPQTFEQLLEYGQKIKKKTGKNGFVCGWGEGWLLNALATEWAFNIMGEENFYKTIDGKIPYTDQRWIEVFNLFKKLRDSGILISDITTMINKESEDWFSKGTAGLSFNGTWSVNVYKQLNPELNYAFFPLPRASSQYPIKIWGGAGSSFMVSKKSPNAAEAVKFLKWLTASEQQNFLVKETNNLPSIKGCTKELPEVLAPLVHTFGSLTHPNIWPKNENSRVLEIFNKGLQQIVMGIKTPEEIASEVQEVKERVFKK